MTSTSTTDIKNNGIPVLDFLRFRHGSTEESQQTATALFEAFRDIGFVYLRNYGLPQETVDEAFSWSAKFFALPQEVKDSVPHPPSGKHHRGYSGVGREQVTQTSVDEAAKQQEVPEIKESFEMGREDDTLMANIWLAEETLPGFREFFNKFYWACREVELEILRALALGMGLAEDYFEKFHAMADNQTRILHYPAIEEEMLQAGKRKRINAHTDFGTLTLVFQDEVGGLEVEDQYRKGVFHPAPFIPGTVVVNIGDLLMRWSNDILKSTMHRVQAPSVSGPGGITPARYSIPYFCGPDKDKLIECLPGCFGTDRPKRYEPITAGGYIDMRLNASY